MPQHNILVVEDEPIVAKDIQRSLERLGYGVATLASSGEEAIRKATADHPDLILMDILLKGDLDGVETVKRIRRQSDVPVIYLTAYADDQTRERAKVTSPAGYMVKPYQPTDLGATIELALHRTHEDERRSQIPFGWADGVFHAGDAVMTTDRQGRIVSLDTAAERLTGWHSAEASGMRAMAMIVFDSDTTEESDGNPVMLAMAQMQIIRLQHPVILTKEGARRLIGGYVRPRFDDLGAVSGALIVLHGTGQAPQRQQASAGATRRTLGAEVVAESREIMILCAWCKRVPDASGAWRVLDADLSHWSTMPVNGGLCPDCMGRCFPASGQ